MAARRLVIVMLVLLGVSIVATALLPETTQLEREEEVEVSPPPRPAAGGELVTERIDAAEPEPSVIELRVGDQLALTVRSPDADEVAIPGIGELRFVGPLAPARFDFLAWEVASYEIRLIEADRVIGRIEVGPARSRAGDPDRRLTREQRGNGMSEGP